MKSIKILALTMIATAVLCPNIYSEPVPVETQIERESPLAIEVQDLDRGLFEQILKGEKPDLSVKIAQGEQLRLNLFLKGDYVELESSDESPLYIKIKKDIYLRNISGKLLFSLDNLTWQPMDWATDIVSSAIEKWQPWITGHLFVGFDINKPAETTVTAGAEIYERSTHKSYEKTNNT